MKPIIVNSNSDRKGKGDKPLIKEINSEKEHPISFNKKD